MLLMKSFDIEKFYQHYILFERLICSL